MDKKDEKPGDVIDAAGEAVDNIGENEAAPPPDDGKSGSEKLEAGGDEGLEGPHKKSPVDKVAEDSEKPPAPAKAAAKKSMPVRILKRMNVYVIVFLLLIVIGAGTVGVMYFINRKEENIRINTTELTQEDVDELVGADATIGDPKQTLTVESNSVFTGKMFIRNSLDLSGELKVGGSLSIPTLNVAGDGRFTRINVNQIDASGDVTIGGRLSVQNGLQVNGSLSVNGPLSASEINIDKVIQSHINTSGSTPTRSNGPALGGGGTASVSGTDASGLINISTGGGAGAGVLVTINFSEAYDDPHVVLTPSNPGAANLGYYVTNIGKNSFAVASTNASSGQVYQFQYVVVD
jgi:hypothetical protein